ncbi:ATP synthase F0 subunit 6 (mitochondrion) [Eremothecium sinecaudum]|uniref:ATP synthase subunit a n=1 Tax=Eremothecium sinecaudum TaxID=45286 RepID=A0A0X8HWX5_9SACH|nr:ATP synthase F0 subunit 6 [Eremothecium sinecaudum]AMD23032.1 ATP synthase F0 subunit 6 [Eremothecium sinecaudum]
MYITSPLDQFEIKDLLGLYSPFIDFSMFNVTTFSLYTMILLFIFTLFNYSILTDMNIKGSKWLLYQETLHDTLMNMVKGQVTGKFWGNYYPLIYTMFVFIFMTNMISMIPYSFALTSHMIMVVSTSMMIWMGVTIIGFQRHGTHFFSLFVPVGTPLYLVPLLVLIELLSYVARSLSLGLRLSANVLSGHLLLMILSGLLYNFMTINMCTFTVSMIPLLTMLGIVCLEFAITIIQAYVWSILMSTYLKDTLYLH